MFINSGWIMMNYEKSIFTDLYAGFAIYIGVKESLFDIVSISSQ